MCSEAMYWLSVPTSRAATLIVTRDPIPRDIFYNGHVKNERGAVVMRLAPTWFRFGSFEILAKKGETEALKQLADKVLETVYPEIREQGEDGYLAMFSQVVDKTADLVARQVVD